MQTHSWVLTYTCHLAYLSWNCHWENSDVHIFPSFHNISRTDLLLFHWHVHICAERKPSFLFLLTAAIDSHIHTQRCICASKWHKLKYFVGIYLPDTASFITTIVASSPSFCLYLTFSLSLFLSRAFFCYSI